MPLFVTGVLIALVVSALCSVMEATVLSMTPAQVALLNERRPRVGKIWVGFKNNVERPIAVILLLNTAAHTVGASVAGAKFGEVFGEEYLWLFALVFTYVMLQFTEILAKSLGVRFNRRLAPVIARPLHVSALALQPVLWLVHTINRPFEGRRRGDETPATIEEITALAGLARLSREIGPQQERIIATAPRLSAYRINDIKIPLSDIAWLDAGNDLEQAISYARRHVHTRFPVRQNADPNQVAGYVNVKEMLLLATDDVPDAEEGLPLRPILTVTESDSAAEVLTRFVRERTHIAVVQDAGGQTSGLVTMEDIVEELLGDIRDEFDRLPRQFHTVSERRWRVGGGVPMRELRAKLADESLPDTEQQLALWLEEVVDGPMQVGARYEHGNLRFSVTRIRRGSVHEVTVRRVED